MQVVAVKVKPKEEAFDQEPILRRDVHFGEMALEASIAGFAERYGRGRTSHTVHVWWARRPHSAMRALVFAALAKCDAAQGVRMASHLAAGDDPTGDVLSEAQACVRSGYAAPPRVLDMFGGGGTIPYEAALLGAQADALDLNELSVFVQKTNLVMSQKAFAASNKKAVLKQVERSGNRVLETLKANTRDLYPDRVGQVSGHEAFGYFWTYSMQCENCAHSFFLSKRPWLSLKKGRRLGFAPEPSDARRMTIKEIGEHEEVHSNWVGRNGTVKCPKCDTLHKGISIKKATEELVAIGYKIKGGKTFELASDRKPATRHLQKRKADLYKKIGVVESDTEFPRWSGIVNPSLYGIERHVDIFNPRQTIVVLELVSALRDEYKILREKIAPEVASYVVAVLSALVDQVVDWNSRLSMWIAQNEQVGRGFCGPGLSMLWDYVETDQLGNGPANLWDKLSRIVEGVSQTPKFAVIPSVQRGCAQELPYPDETFDAIVTDPPYYDNMYYNVLADSFYIWKRMIFHDDSTLDFAHKRTTESGELVASAFRQGGSENAHSWYCEQLTRTLKEAHRVLRTDGILAFVYGHSSFRGWEAVVSAFRAAHLIVDGVEPLSIERKQRPRAMTSEAVNTCLVLVARKGGVLTASLTGKDLTSLVNRHYAVTGKTLGAAGWQPADVGMAVFAKVVGALANAKGSTDHSDRDILQMAERAINKLIPEFRLQNRKSL